MVVNLGGASENFWHSRLAYLTVRSRISRGNKGRFHLLPLLLPACRQNAKRGLYKDGQNSSYVLSTRLIFHTRFQLLSQQLCRKGQCRACRRRALGLASAPHFIMFP